MKLECAFLVMVASLAISAPSITECRPVPPIDELSGLAESLPEAKGGVEAECKEGCFGCCGGDSGGGGISPSDFGVRKIIFKWSDER